MNNLSAFGLCFLILGAGAVSISSRELNIAVYLAAISILIGASMIFDDLKGKVVTERVIKYLTIVFRWFHSIFRGEKPRR